MRKRACVQVYRIRVSVLALAVLCLAIPASAGRSLDPPRNASCRPPGLAREYSGPERLVEVLETNAARSLTLGSGDYDEDGVPDLVSGHATADDGILTIRRGDIGAIYPNSLEARHRDQAAASAGDAAGHAPFLSPARVFEMPARPELLATGDFDADGHLDVVAAAIGGDALYALSGDGRGGVGPARALRLPGRVTALVAGEVDRADGLADLAIGVAGPGGPRVLLFEGPEGALASEPEVLDLPAEAVALALGQLDGEYPIDLAVAAGSELLIVHGRDLTLSPGAAERAEARSAAVDRHTFPATLASIAVGDFAGDRRSDVAALTDDGAVHVLSRADAQGFDAESRGWSLATAGWQLATEARPSATHLARARVSGSPRDDLVVADPAGYRLQVLSAGEEALPRPAANGRNGDSALDMRPAALDVGGKPVAVIPMRLNADALSDLVVLGAGASAPAVFPTVARATFTVTNTSASGPGSLRQAIADANANPGPDAISFNIEGEGPHTIPVMSSLPNITSPVTIDATTQPGFAGKPLVELRGRGSSSVESGLTIVAGSSTVRGLVINRFLEGITVSSNGDNVVEGNFIGTDVDGTADAGNANEGVNLDTTSGNTVGGTTDAARNVISGNDDDGVDLGPGADGNRIQGNFVGTDVTGAVGLGNGDDAVDIEDAHDNTIGGAMPGESNVLAGNGDRGVEITDGGSGTLIQGNFIGTNAAGTAAVGNATDGVILDDSPDNSIGGPAPAARNVLSGNGDEGVDIRDGGSTGNLVEGNFIGTDLTGALAVGNGEGGVALLSASRTTISGNTVAFNGTGGVVVLAGAGNAIRGNSVFSNGGLGIDLFPAGVTANDPRDADTGPNNRQNFPVLTSVVGTSDGVAVEGTLDSSPSSTFTIELFANATCDPSGNGEGQAFVGSATVTTDASGKADVRVSVPVALAATPFVTATATDAAGNTSEFSACRQLAITLTWQPPDSSSSLESPPPRCLTLAFESNPRAGARPLDAWSARGGEVTAYRVYSSSQPNVQPTAGNLVREVPPADTSADVPAPAGGAFFVVTASYADGGESRPSNEISVNLPAATIEDVQVTDKKLVAVGTGVTDTVEVFVDGIAFTAPAKVKRSNTKVIQKGTLMTGETIGQYITPGRQVTLSFRNSNGGIATVKFTR